MMTWQMMLQPAEVQPSGTATPTDHGGTNPGVLNDASATSGDYSRGQGMTTASAEALGDASGNQFAEMAFSIVY